MLVLRVATETVDTFLRCSTEGGTSEFGKICTLRHSCSFETQRYRTSGLKLVTAAIILGNTVLSINT